jgi:hypothetical protein
MVLKTDGTAWSVRETLAFRPWGSSGFPLLPTAFAVGCILTPLRGCRLTDSFALSVEILFLTHTLEAAPLQGIAYVPELTWRAHCMACH